MKKSYRSLSLVFAAIALTTSSAFASETQLSTPNQKDVSFKVEGEGLYLRNAMPSIPAVDKDEDGKEKKDGKVNSVKENKFHPGFRVGASVEMNGYEIDLKGTQFKHYTDAEPLKVFKKDDKVKAETPVVEVTEVKDKDKTPVVFAKETKTPVVSEKKALDADESKDKKEEAADEDRSHTSKFKLQDASLTVGRTFNFDNGFSIKPMVGAHGAKITRNFPTKLSDEEKAERTKNGENIKKYSNKDRKFRALGPQAGVKVEQKLVEGLKLVASVDQSFLINMSDDVNVTNKTVIPVTKGNIGAAWSPLEAFEVAAGYEMQYWCDGSEITTVAGDSLSKNLVLDGFTVKAKVAF